MPWSFVRMRYLTRRCFRPGELGERQWMENILVPWNIALAIVCRLDQIVGQPGPNTPNARISSRPTVRRFQGREIHMRQIWWIQTNLAPGRRNRSLVAGAEGIAMTRLRLLSLEENIVEGMCDRERSRNDRC